MLMAVALMLLGLPFFLLGEIEIWQGYTMFVWVVFLGSPLVMMVTLRAGSVKAITAFQSLCEKQLDLTVDLLLPSAPTG